MGYKVFTLSSGSTSTKLAVFDGKDIIFKANVQHDPEVLKSFDKASEQRPYRVETILAELEKNGISINDMDAFAAYSGGIASTCSGIFPVNEKMIYDCTIGTFTQHPAILGAPIIDEFAKAAGKPAYVIDPPDVDEFEDVARISEIKGIYRESHVHVLNQKAAATNAAEQLGKAYEDCNLVVCHVGGGLSITAQKKGRIVDGNDVINGEGPMAPNRSGNVPVVPVIKMCYSGEYTEDQMRHEVRKVGGLMSLLGTDSMIEIEERIASGDKWAELVFDSFAYQLAKSIGSYACVLEGDVDAIVFTGGGSNDKKFIADVTKYVKWIAPIIVFAGDFEMEALAAGAIRALDGKEKVHEYTGVPVWSGFDFEPEK